MKNRLLGYEIEAARLWLAMGYSRKTVAAGMGITKDQVRGVAEGRHRAMAEWLDRRGPWNRS